MEAQTEISGINLKGMESPLWGPEQGKRQLPFLCPYIPGRSKLGGDNVLGAVVMETVLSPSP